MKIDVVTIFPKMFLPVLNESIIKRAQAKNIVKINIYNLRDFSKERHRKVDDRPYGGGPGMVMRPEPFFEAVKYIKGHGSWVIGHGRVILLSPQGKRLSQTLARRLSKYKHLILLCGHYEGIDERVRRFLVDEEISIGDYILTGGELPAMVLIDAVVRLLRGALGDNTSIIEETFSKNLIEYPQYTRPSEFRGLKVPEVLLSGDHSRITEWRRKESLKRTARYRPDLL